MNLQKIIWKYVCLGSNLKLIYVLSNENHGIKRKGFSPIVSCNFNFFLLIYLYISSFVGAIASIKRMVMSKSLFNQMASILIFCLPIVSVNFDWKPIVPISDYPTNKEFYYISLGWGDKGFFLDTHTWDDLTYRDSF